MSAEEKHVLPLARGLGRRALVTPQTAGWAHLGFEVRRLAAGEVFQAVEPNRESCVVLLEGEASLTVGDLDSGIVSRRGVFSGLPHAVYAPPAATYWVTAHSEVEFAVGTAPAVGRFPARLISPADVKVEIRGGHNVTRQISHVIDPGEAERLLCVEVYTPSGNWSSYPPHRHDEEVPGVEVDADEVYHFRIAPPGGWSLQRLYTDDRSLDEVVLAKDGDTVLVRRGYHPVVMAPGYDGYYLNFLAGENPSWIARDEPDLAWVRGQWDGGPARMRLPLGSGDE